MDLIMRRREMMKSITRTWDDISNNNYLLWARGSRVDVTGQSIYFYPNSLGYGQTLTTNNLKYRWGEIKNGILHFACDYILSGIVSGGNVPFAIATYNIQNPTSTTTRQAYGSIARLTEDGTGHIDVEIACQNLTFDGTLNDNHYFGSRIYAHTGANSTLYLSNIVFEVSI